MVTRKVVLLVSAASILSVVHSFAVSRRSFRSSGVLSRTCRSVQEDSSYEFCVIGGGVSGLTAAITVARNAPTNSRVLLMEPSDTIGCYHTDVGLSHVDLSTLPPGGLCAVAEELLRKANAAGVEVRTGESISKVSKNKSGFLSSLFSKKKKLYSLKSKEGCYTIQADTIIFDTDLPLAKTLLHTFDGSEIQDDDVGCLSYSFNGKPLFQSADDNMERLEKRSNLIHSVCFPLVSDTRYALTADSGICSVTVVKETLFAFAGNEDHLDSSIRKQLSEWLPEEKDNILNKWKLHGVYKVSTAANVERIDPTPLREGRPTTIYNGKLLPDRSYVCGMDVAVQATLKGILRSGMNAGQAALLESNTADASVNATQFEDISTILPVLAKSVGSSSVSLSKVAKNLDKTNSATVQTSLPKAISKVVVQSKTQDGLQKSREENSSIILDKRTSAKSLERNASDSESNTTTMFTNKTLSLGFQDSASTYPGGMLNTSDKLDQSPVSVVKNSTSRKVAVVKNPDTQFMETSQDSLVENGDAVASEQLNLRNMTVKSNDMSTEEIDKPILPSRKEEHLPAMSNQTRNVVEKMASFVVPEQSLKENESAKETRKEQTDSPTRALQHSDNTSSRVKHASSSAIGEMAVAKGNRRKTGPKSQKTRINGRPANTSKKQQQGVEKMKSAVSSQDNKTISTGALKENSTLLAKMKGKKRKSSSYYDKLKSAELPSDGKELSPDGSDRKSVVASKNLPISKGIQRTAELSSDNNEANTSRPRRRQQRGRLESSSSDSTRNGFPSSAELSLGTTTENENETKTWERSASTQLATKQKGPTETSTTEAKEDIPPIATNNSDGACEMTIPSTMAANTADGSVDPASPRTTETKSETESDNSRRASTTSATPSSKGIQQTAELSSDTIEANTSRPRRRQQRGRLESLSSGSTQKGFPISAEMYLGTNTENENKTIPSERCAATNKDGETVVPNDCDGARELGMPSTTAQTIETRSETETEDSRRATTSNATPFLTKFAKSPSRNKLFEETVESSLTALVSPGNRRELHESDVIERKTTTTVPGAATTTTKQGMRKTKPGSNYLESLSPSDDAAEEKLSYWYENDKDDDEDVDSEEEIGQLAFPPKLVKTGSYLDNL